MTRRLRIVVAIAIVSLLGLVAPVAAQETDGGDLTAGEVTVIDYPTVEVLVSLTAADAEAVDGSAFTILEGTEEIIPSVTPLSASGLDVVLAIDISGSMSGAAIESARRAATTFAAEIPATARIAVIGFGPTPIVALEPTTDRTAVNAALAGLQAGGETALHDGVIAAAAQVRESSGRTALVILSDGGDTVSTASLQEATDTATETFDVVHAVSLSTVEQDITTLGSLTADSGVIVQAEDPVALAGVYSDLAGRITNQYVLTWDSGLTADGAVSIRFRNGDRLLSNERTVDVDEVAVAAATVEPTPTVAPATSAPVSEPVASAAPTPVVPGDTVPAWLLWFGIVFVALSLFLAVIVIATPTERRRSLTADLRDRLPRGKELSGIGRRMVDTVERALRRDPDREIGLALRLERAGMSIQPAEFGAAVIGGAAVAALLGLALLGVLGMVLLPAVCVFGALGWVDAKGRRRSRLFTEQLDATLQLIAGSLRSGFGIMQALNTVAAETEWPTNEEFSRILGEVRLGRSTADAMTASARRIDTPDYYWTVQAIAISNEVGGNLAEVLGNVSQTIRQRNTLRRQVVALSAEGRVSAAILLSLPPAMFAWMKYTNPDYVDLLFTRTGGQVALGGGLVLIVLGTLWMRKIVRIQF